jgi:hypothetical protein
MSRREQATAQVDALAGATISMDFRLRCQSLVEFMVAVLSCVDGCKGMQCSLAAT